METLKTEQEMMMSDNHEQALQEMHDAGREIDKMLACSGINIARDLIISEAKKAGAKDIDSLVYKFRDAFYHSFPHESRLHLFDDKAIYSFASALIRLEREGIVTDAESKGWAMKDESPFEESVLEIIQNRRAGAKNGNT